MIFIRSLLFNIVGYGSLAVGCVLNTIIGIFSQKAIMKIWNYGFIPFFAWSLRYIAGIKIEIRGRQYLEQENAIYAGKHESAMETYVMTSIIKRGTFVLKKELTYIPLFGWAQALYGMIPINRSAGSAAMKDMLRKAQKMKEDKRPIIIFPEGTRRQPGQEPVYKPGVALLYQHLDLPVIPFATNTGLFWKKSSFLRYPGTVVFEFMEPLPAGLDKKHFMEELQNRIETKCAELNAEAIKNYPYIKSHMYQAKKD